MGESILMAVAAVEAKDRQTGAKTYFLPDTLSRRFLVPNDAGRATPPMKVSRLMDRQVIFGAEDKEHLRRLLRMYDRFSGCRILSYCLMSNHIHVLLEVPPGCEKGESRSG